MKQKYAIIRDDDQNTLVIREYAELDKEMMSLLCEQAYPQDEIKAAMQEGNQGVIRAIRTNNMYPPTTFAFSIAEAVCALLEEGGNQSAELFFDDKDLFLRADEVPEEDEEEDVDEDVDVDDLLEDEETIDNDFEDEGVLKDLKSSLKVADESNTDSDDAT